MNRPPDEDSAGSGAGAVARRTSAEFARRRQQARGIARWVNASRVGRTLSRFTDVGGNVLSGGMSYQALFAVFSGLWLGFGIFGRMLRSRPELLETVVQQINTYVPGLVAEGGEAGSVSLSLLLDARAFDWTSVIAGFSLLWVAMNWFTGTRRSIRIIFGLEVKQYRNAAVLKLRDLTLAVTFMVAILLSAALTVVSSAALDSVVAWLGFSTDGWLFSWLGIGVRHLAMYLVDVIVLLAIHRYLAEVRVSWWPLLCGCALGGVALLVLKILGTSLLGWASSNALLATFAVFIGLLLWFNFICRALLLTASWIAVATPEEAARAAETPRWRSAGQS